MMEFRTAFGSLSDYEKGHIEIIDDKPMHYTFSNVFEVAQKSAPWEKIAVAKNLENLIETIRAEGVSPWYTCAHDEFALAMDGEVEVHFVDLDPAQRVAPEKEGNVVLADAPSGPVMGYVVLKRGHQALLPANAAYQFRAHRASVLLQQALEGENTVYRWKDICYS
jgi:hypothetical protein